MASDGGRVLRTWLIVLAVVGVGLAAPALAPFDPRLPTGGALQAPSPAHWLGTNDIGQEDRKSVV
jgi:hypothetical protein